jgi:acetolactate synthase-1/3 small subunit
MLYRLLPKHAPKIAMPPVNPPTSASKRHIISILLQNEAGALARVAGLFSTRGYNIESLSVAPTDDPTMSRLTVVTTGTAAVMQQIVNQCQKLVDVVNVHDVTRDPHVERELLLLKLRASKSRLESLRKIAAQAGARILSDDGGSFVVELVDSEAQVNRFIVSAGAYGQILEVVRSGALAVLRGSDTLHGDM